MKKVLTCEHAGNLVPAEFSSLFRGAGDLLATHKGYDPGALDLFLRLVPLADYSRHTEVSRLLVENNRSLDHPELFSKFTRGIPEAQKPEILRCYYYAYRDPVEDRIRAFLGDQQEVLHLSVHSFTPVLNGEERTAEIGILFDPARSAEAFFAESFRQALHKELPWIRIAFNYPYLGTADGFTTYLRTRFPEGYSGIELEVNQKLVSQNVLDPEIKLGVFNAFRKSRD